MAVETVCPAHAPALAVIHAGAFAPAARWGADAIGLQLGLPGVFGFADAAGAMVLARVAAEEAEILTLAVLPAARRRGLGRAMMVAAMTEAARRGAAAMLLEVAADNGAAAALYASLEFTAVGRRTGYYGVGRDALVLRTPLAGLPAAAG